MNKWNQLKTILNKTFGFAHIKKSSVKKTKQYYDEKSDEHVFVIEYRVMRDMNPKRTQHEKRIEQRSDKVQMGKLLQDINAQVVYEEVRGDVSEAQTPPNPNHHR